MSQNWLRHFEIRLTNKNGDVITLSDFKATFQISWFNLSTETRIADIKIYNLSDDTSNKILGTEYNKIELVAGYDGLADTVSASQVGIATSVPAGKEGQTGGQNFGTIFNGEIVFSLKGRENPTDTYIRIQAEDSHQAFVYATISQTISAGWGPVDYHLALMKSFNEYGVVAGNTPEMPEIKFPRAKTMFGSTRHYMDNLAAMCDARWMLVDGKVEMYKKNEYNGNPVVVLNSQTGLIGMPQQTIGNGINVRCLINPNITVNGLIQLDQKSVYQAALNENDVAMNHGRVKNEVVDGNIYQNGALNQPSSIATDGVYIVNGIVYTGDTRGQAWYMDLMCYARGDQSVRSAKSLMVGG